MTGSIVSTGAACFLETPLTILFHLSSCSLDCGSLLHASFHADAFVSTIKNNTDNP